MAQLPRLPRSLRVMRHREFALVQIGNGISQLGTRGDVGALDGNVIEHGDILPSTEIREQRITSGKAVPELWHSVLMAIPQRISLVTLGSRDVPSLRAFYEGWGWSGRTVGDAYVEFDVGATRLAICDYDTLVGETPGTEPPPPLPWNGVVLSLNVESRQSVDAIWAAAIAAGAREVAAPQQREWGGYSGYVSDPEAHRWEIAWAPA